MKTFALVLAAGSGERFGALNVPKHLTEISNVPVLIWTLKTIVNAQIFDKVVVVARPQDMQITERQIKLFLHDKMSMIEIVEIMPGGERVETFKAGLGHIQKHHKPSSEDIVALFDANRPLGTQEQLLQLHKCVEKYHCVCPARGVVNGVAETEDGFITSVPDKSLFVEFVTPEFINYGFLSDAMMKSDKDYACLVEYALSLGVKPFVIDASPLNVKLTFPEDATFLEGLIQKYNLEVPQKTV